MFKWFLWLLGWNFKTEHVIDLPALHPVKDSAVYLTCAGWLEPYDVWLTFEEAERDLLNKIRQDFSKPVVDCAFSHTIWKVMPKLQIKIRFEYSGRTFLQDGVCTIEFSRTKRNEKYQVVEAGFNEPQNRKWIEKINLKKSEYFLKG